MTVEMKKVMKQSGKTKKKVSRRKNVSIPMIIAKNRKALDQLKPEESSEESESLSSDSEVEEKQINKIQTSRLQKRTSSVDYIDNDDDSLSKEESDQDMETDLLEDKEHRKSLAKLKDTDPEFYKFLEENDKKLLQFNVSDSESEYEGSEEEKVHQPPDDLEIGSDEDDFEEGEEWKGGSGKLITLALVSEWQKKLHTKVDVQIVGEIIKAFQAALETVSSSEDAEQRDYRVDGSSVFNAVVQLCVMELQPALLKLLNINSTKLVSAQPAKSKRWTKIKGMLKNYLTDLLKLLSAVSSGNILTVLLKHLHQMSLFFSYYHSLTKSALKELITLWSTSAEETVRVVAFLCILRITNNQQKSLLDSVLKSMYVAYITNCKFVSVSTLPNINFMRRSLAEMFSLDATVSYQHAFLYIRQLAIHLRNAVTIHKKESIQAVCNWQYVNSLRLWADLISSTDANSQLRALLYPLVQVTIGCIKLVSTARYIPLRFHCCQLLTMLSKETDTYIPVLPFIVESLTLTDFNKKHKKLSMKPMDLTCILRVSNAALSENGFKDAIIDQVYQLLVEYCASESHRISFPDLILPSVTQLRKFVKECKTSKYNQKLRQALAKMEENSKFVETERQKVTFSLGDAKAIQAWETSLQTRGTPLSTFFKSWLKIHQRQVAKRATDNDQMGDYKLPQLKRRAVKKQIEEPSGPVELFPSDSEDNFIGFGDEEEPVPKKKKKKQEKSGKPHKLPEVLVENVKEESDSDNEMEDIVEEFTFSDLE